MLLMPTNPSMLQARDAQLAADLMRFGGANQKELWLEFARHGFGTDATSTNTTANTDTDPTPDFECRWDDSRDRDVHGAEAQRKRRSTRGSSSVTTRPASRRSPTPTRRRRAPNLDDTARFAPGTYEFVATAPGYGHVRFREQIREGKN